MTKAQKALGKKLPRDKYDWFGPDYEVTKKNRAAIEKARIKVEKEEAQVANLRESEKGKPCGARINEHEAAR
jgi:hypothetical protein